MRIEIRWAAFLIVVLLVLTFYAVVAPPVLRYLLFAAWIASMAVLWNTFTAGESGYVRVLVALGAMGIVAFVVIAQSSQRGSDVLLAVIAVLVLGLTAWRFGEFWFAANP